MAIVAAAAMGTAEAVAVDMSGATATVGATTAVLAGTITGGMTAETIIGGKSAGMIGIREILDEAKDMRRYSCM